MCDDEGRFLADPRQVKADVWPLDDDITPKKLAAWLPKLAEVTVTSEEGVKVPAVVLYEVDGVKYGFLPGFVKHQKISHPTPSTLPKPPSIVRNDSGAPPEDSGAAPEDSGTAPDSFRPEVEEDVDVDKDLEEDIDVEEEVEGNGKDPATASADDSTESSVDQLLRSVPAPHMWRAEIKACLTGMPGHHKATQDQIEIAARDMLANGKTQHPSLRQFRRYIEGAAADAPRHRNKASPMDRSIANTRQAFGGAK